MADPAWLSADLAIDLMPPRMNRTGERSAVALRAVIEQFDVANAERYRKRDVDGNGSIETFCNFFVYDVCAAMQAPVPRMRANDYIPWMLKQDALGTWLQLRRPWLARVLARNGCPVIAVWPNPSGASGHVAMVVPSRSELDSDTTFIAQAGGTNFPYGRLEEGFGQRLVAFFAHF